MSRLESSTLMSPPDKSGQTQVLESYMQKYSPQRMVIRCFDHWIEHNLPRQFAAHTFEIKSNKGEEITVEIEPGMITLGSPKVSTNMVLTPLYCRDNSENYSFTIRGKVTYRSKTRVIATEEIKIAEIPLMVRSKLCALGANYPHEGNLTPGQIRTLGEDPNETGGYFIIGGNERSILTQEMIRLSIPMLSMDAKKNVAVNTMTCGTASGTTPVKVRPGVRWNTIKVGGGMTSFLGKNRFIPVFMVFSLIGYNLQNAMRLILSLVSDELRSDVEFFLTPSIVKSSSGLGSEKLKAINYVYNKQFQKKTTSSTEVDRNDVRPGAKKVVIKKTENASSERYSEDSIISLVRKNLFTHIADSSVTLDDNNGHRKVHRVYHDKARMLAIMVVQMVRHELGDLELDDRDHWGTKRLETAGRMMEIRMNALLSSTWKEIEVEIDKLNGGNGSEVINKFKNIGSISDKISKCFTGAWSEKKGGGQKSETVTDSLKREAPAAVLSQIARVSAPASRHKKQGTIREIQSSQVGYICIAETPESEACGLIKNMASTCYVTVDRGESMENGINRVRFALVGDYASWYASLNERSAERVATLALPIPAAGWKEKRLDIKDYFWNDNVYIFSENIGTEFQDVSYDELENDYQNLVGQMQNPTDLDFFLARTILKEEYIIRNYPTPILLDGIPRGYCREPYEVEKHLRTLRRFGFIHHEICVSYHPTKHCLEVFSEGGRTMQPLLVVETSSDGEMHLPIEEDDAWNQDIDELMNQGYVELIDSREVDYIMLAESTELIHQGNQWLREIPQVHAEIDLIRNYINGDQKMNQNIVNAIKALIDLMVAVNEDHLAAIGYTDGFQESDALTSSEFEDFLATIGKDAVQAITKRYHLYQIQPKSATKLELNDLVQSVEMYYGLTQDDMLQQIASLRQFPYTHSQITGTSIFGTLGALAPKSNHSQGPRVSYQAGMSKQALNAYHVNHHLRFDSNAFKVMMTPERPIFETQLSQTFGLCDMPVTCNVIKMIRADPDNPEDAIVVNEDFIASGAFRITKYSTHKLELKLTNSGNRLKDELRLPSNLSDNERHRYHAIGPDGLPIIGAQIRRGDCIVGRIRNNLETNQVENTSLFAGIGDEGFVHRIFVTPPRVKGNIVRVKILQYRDLQIGDKLASRYSQKGTISKILPSELMPRIASGPNAGLAPDFVVNPCAWPSRMPMGEGQEMLSSKAALYTAQQVDATAFEPFHLDYHRQVLRNNGYGFISKIDGQDGSDGKEEIEVPIMYTPPEFIGMGPAYLKPTGEYRKTHVRCFVGPCATQELRHHTEDKYQVRSRGNYRPQTHQPVGGRSKEGGQRFGEMERDALISHGASDILLERLMLVSDAYRMVVCVNCGNIASINFTKGVASCKVCPVYDANGQTQSKDNFAVVQIPYSLKYLMMLLAGAGILITLGVTKKEIALVDGVSA